MENLLFNLDSLESSYGENLLTGVIQLDERISGIENFLQADHKLNDFERTETEDRLRKLIVLNRNIQLELERQAQKLELVKINVSSKDADFNPLNRYTVHYK